MKSSISRMLEISLANYTVVKKDTATIKHWVCVDRA